MRICIKPDYSLPDTARIIGEILDLPFKFDDSGYFEEFPAYSTPNGDVRFALLGPPEKKFMSETLWRDYELKVYVFSGIEQKCQTLAKETQRRLLADGRLRSELMI